MIYTNLIKSVWAESSLILLPKTNKSNCCTMPTNPCPQVAVGTHVEVGCCRPMSQLSRYASVTHLAQQSSFSSTLAFPSGNTCPGATHMAAVTLLHGKDVTRVDWTKEGGECTAWVRFGKMAWKKMSLELAWFIQGQAAALGGLYWSRLPREVVECPSMEIFKTCLVVVQPAVGNCFISRVGLNDLLRFFQPLHFCDSVLSVPA